MAMDWQYEVNEATLDNILDMVENLKNRQNQENKWKNESNNKMLPRSSSSVLNNFTGTVIQYEDINLGKKIGQGGFGVVYFAHWKATVVAVKKLLVERVSKRHLIAFTDEVKLLCTLEHPNIVVFIGACIKTPNLCIVMEYMHESLYEALHIKEYEFSESEKLEVIKSTASAMVYLHERNVVHNDMKSQNILLHYSEGRMPVAKITDFGLSMMKQETETSMSTKHQGIHNFGTPRYSAPEVLRGDILDIPSLKKSDMYSYSLVVYEVICEEEPFGNLNFAQLRTQVGERDRLPDIPVDVCIEKHLMDMLKRCWSRNTDSRPTAWQFLHFIKASHRDQIYEEL